MLYASCNRKWFSTSKIANFVLLRAGWQVKRIITETPIDNNSQKSRTAAKKGLFVLALVIFHESISDPK